MPTTSRYSVYPEDFWRFNTGKYSNLHMRSWLFSSTWKQNKDVWSDWEMDGQGPVLYTDVWILSPFKTNFSFSINSLKQPHLQFPKYSFSAQMTLWLKTTCKRDHIVIFQNVVFKHRFDCTYIMSNPYHNKCIFYISPADSFWARLSFRRVKFGCCDTLDVVDVCVFTQLLPYLITQILKLGTNFSSNNTHVYTKSHK